MCIYGFNFTQINKKDAEILQAFLCAACNQWDLKYMNMCHLICNVVFVYRLFSYQSFCCLTIMDKVIKNCKEFDAPVTLRQVLWDEERAFFHPRLLDI